MSVRDRIDARWSGYSDGQVQSIEDTSGVLMNLVFFAGVIAAGFVGLFVLWPTTVSVATLTYMNIRAHHELDKRRQAKRLSPSTQLTALDRAINDPDTCLLEVVLLAEKEAELEFTTPAPAPIVVLDEYTDLIVFGNRLVVRTYSEGEEKDEVRVFKTARDAKRWYAQAR